MPRTIWLTLITSSAAWSSLKPCLVSNPALNDRFNIKILLGYGVRSFATPLVLWTSQDLSSSLTKRAQEWLRWIWPRWVMLKLNYFVVLFSFFYFIPCFAQWLYLTMCGWGGPSLLKEDVEVQCLQLWKTSFLPTPPQRNWN